MSTIISEQCSQAKQATKALKQLTSQQKQQLLTKMAQALVVQTAQILAANKLDLDTAEQSGMSAALLDRLTLDPERVQAMAAGLKQIAELPEPVGRILSQKTLTNGLALHKVAVPIGVIAIIYESRPNVTVDAVGLCLKSANAVVLKGGKEAINSNRVLAQILQQVLKTEGVDSQVVQFIDATDRSATQELLQQNTSIDLVIPRGGAGLMQAVLEHSTIPVLKHLHGVCHIYVDAKADLDMAKAIVENAKCQRPGVCNAMETLLVHADIAKEFLPQVYARLQEHKVEVFGCEQTQKILGAEIRPASAATWTTEYLDLKCSIKVVPDLDAAIAHINSFGSNHSEAIITEDPAAVTQFMQGVDSAVLYHNASTRFTDGAEFGMGAEMGISTNKLHARGPVGVEELTTYCYQLYGNGQIRA